jgi:hypothetical protein
MKQTCVRDSMPGIARSNSEGFSGTDFSLCGFALASGTQHRLKLVLQDHAIRNSVKTQNTSEDGYKMPVGNPC